MNTDQGHLEIQKKLKSLEPIHFVGIGGSGMAPLAQLSASFGISVTGSDLKDPNLGPDIRWMAQGSALELDAINSAGSVVFSSAISPDNYSLCASRTAGKMMLHRSDLLAMFAESFKTIAVAGTHGKTTTSALIAHILISLGADPTWIIGANFANGRAAFGRGRSNVLVIEADESDGTFLKYRPFISVVNNIEPDHMDFYGTRDRLHNSFAMFLANTSSEGCVVYCKDDAVTDQLAHASGKKLLGFGSSGSADCRLLHSRSIAVFTAGELRILGQSVSFKLPMAGKHNAMNALAAITACKALAFEPAECAGALTDFPGVARRLQPYNTRSGALIFDDYAHNPGKIRSCLAGVYAAFPDRRVIAVFQPHRFSRISSLYAQFVESFSLAQLRVVVLPVYGAGEPIIAGFDPETVAGDIARESGATTFPAHTLKEAADLVKSMMDPNLDLLVTIGAGDVWKVAQDVAEGLA